MKILCCGFFPALQRTIEYSSFRTGEVNRAKKVSVTASGKVANVARVVKQLGGDPLLLSFIGGATGETVKQLLAKEQVDCRWIATAAATRICQTLLSDDSDEMTELVENSDSLSAAEWKALIKAFQSVENEFEQIIISGTLPPHAPETVYAELLAHTAGRKVLIDSHGAPLLATLERRPAIVKINAEELCKTIQPPDGKIKTAAKELLARGAGAVGITQGGDCALLFTPDAEYIFEIPAIDAVNPIGSGDSVSAGMAFALAKGSSLVEAFIFGLACGTSNAMNLEPGKINPEQIASLIPGIKTTDFH
ncbi:MAG: PfkB family carbohydrate kinase [Kiritimatiellales bacterium]